MDGTTVEQAGAQRLENNAKVVGARVPLSMVADGDTVQVVKVGGGKELRQHLAELGFVEGAEVMVISRSQHDVIVKVKEANLGLSRDMAKKIMTA